MDAGDYIGIKEAAVMLDVHYNTVRRIPPSELPYWRLGNLGHRRYDPRDVQRYMDRRRVVK